MRFVNGTFLSHYDPTIEGLSLVSAARREADYFLKQRSTNAQVKSMAHPILCVFLHQKMLVDSDQYIALQLEILDTAGTDQFHALNERYIKVRSRFSIHHT